MTILKSNRKVLATMIAALVCVGASAPIFAQDQAPTGDSASTASDTSKDEKKQARQAAKQQAKKDARNAAMQGQPAQAQPNPNAATPAAVDHSNVAPASRNASEKDRGPKRSQHEIQRDLEQTVPEAQAAQRQRQLADQKQSEKAAAAASRQQDQQQQRKDDRQAAAKAAADQEQRQQAAAQADRQQNRQQDKQEASKAAAKAADRDQRQQAAAKADRQQDARVQAREQKELQQQQAKRRLSQQQQQQRIDQQKQRIKQYQQRLDKQQATSQRLSQKLQAEHRMSRYRFHQGYMQRLQQQRAAMLSVRFDYNNDPYFYSAPIYRHYRAGRWYDVNMYGVNYLRKAANTGYQEGFAEGQADREDRARYGYADSFAYQDASFGYDGFHLSDDDYTYYFRQGFSRGYQDGYYSRYRYGGNMGGTVRLQDAALSLILNLKSLR